MMTYYELAKAYFRKAIINAQDEISENQEEQRKWLWEVRGNFHNDIGIRDEDGFRIKTKEMVMSNIQYVMTAMKDAGWLSDKAKADAFCNQDWDTLDFIARWKAAKEVFEESMEFIDTMLHAEIPEDKIYVFFVSPFGDGEHVSAITKGGAEARKMYWKLTKKYGKARYETLNPDVLML